MDQHSRHPAAGPSRHPELPQSSTKQQELGCDRCQELQIRCAFNQGKGGGCTNCFGHRLQCTWTKTSKPQPLPNDSYAEYLQARVKEVEQRLKGMFPGINPKREVDSLLSSEPPAGSIPQDLHHKPSHSTSKAVPPSDAASSQPTQPSRTSSTSSAVAANSTTASSRFIQKVRLTDVRSGVTPIDLSDNDTIWSTAASTQEDKLHYYGQSSAEAFSRDAEIIREGFAGGSMPETSRTHRRPEFWRPTSAETRVLNYDPWETEDGLKWELPPDDLIPDLLDGFFNNANLFFPMLHRPLFEKQLREGLHVREPNFLRVVLLVCANGARWCSDPRVLDDKRPVTLSAGYRWFRQIRLWNNTFTERSTLWDAQILLLALLFLHGSSAHYGSWTMSGVGIRVMIDAGAHRKRSTVSIENELYKRCFWSFLLLDRLSGLTMGRHSAIQDLDSDLDEALEVDDEYWSLEPNAPPPVQPPGLPSRLTMFNRLIGLCRVMGRGLQTVFALSRTKRQIGLEGPQGDIWMMQDMNTQLNLWAHTMPPHLRLPHPTHYSTFPFLDHAVAMWSAYFYIVQATNRQFIAQTSPLALSCLRVCREAARTCARMLDTHRLTPGSRPLPSSFQAAFSSAMVLVIDLIAQGKAERLAKERGSPNLDVSGSGEYTVEQKEEDVKRCMRVLEWAEGYFHIAGRLHDILREFEESWRPQLSLSARSARSATSSSSRRDPTQQQQISQPQIHPPLFSLSESVALPPDAQPKLEDKADVTFDIAYTRPEMPNDMLPRVQHIPPPTQTDIPHDMRQQPRPKYPTTQLREAMSRPHPSESYPANYPADMYGNAPGPLAHPRPTFPHDNVPHANQYQEQTWNNPVQRPSSFDPTYDGQTFRPGRGYPYINTVMQPPEEWIPGASRTGPSYTNAFSNNSPGFDVGSAAIPGLGIFPPGGWILSLNETRSSGDGMLGGGMGGPPASTNGKPPKPPMLIQWDAMMQNTLDLNERNLDLYETGGR